MDKIAKSIAWFRPEFGDLEQKLVHQVIASNFINDGEVTRKFENRVANLIGVKHCVAVTSGTTAISLALMGLGIGPGDEVIVPDFTFIATANAARLAGAQVKLVDIVSDRLTIDVDQVATVLGPDTKAIIAVDINGRGCDYERLQALCDKHGLALVCDAAEALGSGYKGRLLGSFGNAGCFSFSAAKTVSTGQGGMIATNDTDLYHRLLELKDQGRRKRGTGGNDLHPVMGFNFKYTDLQAAVGLAQLDRMNERLAHFRRRNQWYSERLNDCPGVTMIPDDSKSDEVTQWMDILIDDRERVVKMLAEIDIDCRPFWYPLHTNTPYADNDQKFGNTISVSSRGVWLPSNFGLTESEVDYVCDVIRNSLVT